MANTRNLKQIIIRHLKEHHLLSASAIKAILISQGKTYNKTSIYRALEQLQKDGIVCQHHFGTSEASYELREHHHAHLVCNTCGDIRITECTYNEPRAIATFVVDHHHTTLFGICKKCSQSQA